MFKAGRALTPGEEELPRWWFVDEITAVGEQWSEVIKDLRDDTALRRDCVVLTGSSSRGFRTATDNLAGRRGPDSATSDRFEELAFWIEPLVAAWEDFLRVGGYPRAVADYVETADVRSGFIHDLWDVVRGDAIRAANMPESAIVALLERLAISIASPLNASDVARDVGLRDNHATNARIDVLVMNFLAWRCPRGDSGVPSPTAQRKLYFTDPLLARLAAELDPHRTAPDISKLSEQQVGVALARGVEQRRPGSFARESRLMYARTPTRREIDFVGPDLDVHRRQVRRLRVEARSADHPNSFRTWHPRDSPRSGHVRRGLGRPSPSPRLAARLDMT